MRILHTSDWHLGRIFHGIHLTEDQAYLLDQFVHLVKDVRPEIILIAGDVYDRSVPPTEAVKLLDEVLSRIIMDLKVPVMLIAGNHDSPERLGFGTRLLAQQELFLFGQLDKNLSPVVLHDSHGPVHFCPVPYAEPPLVKDRLGAQEAGDHNLAMMAAVNHFMAQVPPGARTVALAHAYVLGCQESESERPLSVGGAGSVDTACFKPFHYSALGHLHQPQSAGSGHIRYAGSLMKYSFSETSQRKSITLVEMDKEGKVRQEEIVLSPRREVRRLEGYLTDILAGPSKGENREDYLMVFLKDTGAILDIMGKLRAVYPNVLHIERSYLGEGGVLRGMGGDHRRLSELDLFSSFFKEVTGKTLSDGETRVFVNTVNTLNREEREALV
ncbi:MAG: exonuclease SbcCD subunit D [Bacillota bacterium]